MEFTYLRESVSIKRVSEDAKAGVFAIEGLYRGYGLTVGNALRRVLLSSLPGAAVTRFKIKGIKHEFTTIPGVKEDVVEIGLNFKKVRFHFYAGESQVLTLKIKGERQVKAGDIKGNADVEVANPNLHIATLTSKDAELDIELTVEKGLGYVPVESQKVEKLSIGTMALDAVFSPVVNVNFTVENMRVGDRTDYNRVLLHVETDGTVSPSRAVHKAADILLDHFKRISDVEIQESKSVGGPVLEEVKKPKKKLSK
ncbi:MAG: DNA-directed RNA polymerase subunit alpha [Candidatus Colwellbacteria bacterium CG23_combo_of_CG06-09_8_20_14_all_42_19]|uniref:DNA-directed RNA polymerase subunit alpha n=1 Tax=Candidatus Colwellbacteria bacterium CG23_combo_of_CG06-09_8_20_14_all_42_19 TaxID=1974541 RepID=A0A2H0ANJ1_9BACT|nr:MAG: DNA-directed RNA polymerase subunit alpha [Candidatus Colwellbacteria bacterium CG23_combo_of_CG06-09_8_20_14_all_42_19]